MSTRSSGSTGPDAYDLSEAIQAMEAYHRSTVWVEITYDPRALTKLIVRAHGVLRSPAPMTPSNGLRVFAKALQVERRFPHPDHRELESCISFVLNSLDYKMAEHFWEQMPLDFVGKPSL